MRAVPINRFEPEVLDVVDLPDPVPGEGQRLYEVSTAGVNYADTHHRHRTPVTALESSANRRTTGVRSGRSVVTDAPVSDGYPATIARRNQCRVGFPPGRSS
jgi:hypothetical protein